MVTALLPTPKREDSGFVIGTGPRVEMDERVLEVM